MRRLDEENAYVYEETHEHGAKGNVSLYWVVYLHSIHVCNIQFDICDIYG